MLHIKETIEQHFGAGIDTDKCAAEMEILFESVDRQNEHLMQQNRIMLAAMAMQGRMAAFPPYHLPLNPSQIEVIAHDAVLLADATLKELLK